MTLTLLHTAEVHRCRFEAIRDQTAPDVALTHHVRETWLQEAQDGVSATLEAEIWGWVRAQDGPVLCTCTTIGAVAEAAGAVRIDRPLMQAAAKVGGPYVLAFCLESTRAVSAALLREAAGDDADIRLLPLAEHWPLFEAGDLTGFQTSLAEAIRNDAPTEGCVVLAQASMAGAAELLEDLPVPVLASPVIAFRAALERLGSATPGLQITFRIGI